MGGVGGWGGQMYESSYEVLDQGNFTGAESTMVVITAEKGEMGVSM